VAATFHSKVSFLMVKVPGEPKKVFHSIQSDQLIANAYVVVCRCYVILCKYYVVLWNRVLVMLGSHVNAIIAESNDGACMQSLEKCKKKY
jgi:hypothetical protein